MVFLYALQTLSANEAAAVEARAPETTMVASAMGRKVLTIGEVGGSLTTRK